MWAGRRIDAPAATMVLCRNGCLDGGRKAGAGDIIAQTCLAIDLDHLPTVVKGSAKIIVCGASASGEARIAIHFSGDMHSCSLRQENLPLDEARLSRLGDGLRVTDSVLRGRERAFGGAGEATGPIVLEHRLEAILL